MRFLWLQKNTKLHARTHTNLPPPPPTKTNTYFHHITPEVSRVHIEFPSPVWLCLWQVITYWMLFLFIYFLEREIHLLHGETVSRNFIFYFQVQTLHVLPEPSRTRTIIHWFIVKLHEITIVILFTVSMLYIMHSAKCAKISHKHNTNGEIQISPLYLFVLSCDVCVCI